MLHKIIKLFICIATPLVLGSISGIVTSKEITSWYLYLNKPAFNPPNYLFAPVWTTLYILMGVSLYVIISKATTINKTKAYLFFGLQLWLNFLWSFIFFYFHQVGLAFIEIIAIWFSIISMIYFFYPISKQAAWLNVMYLLWVSFATVLNGSIYIIN